MFHGDMIFLETSLYQLRSISLPAIKGVLYLKQKLPTLSKAIDILSVSFVFLCFVCCLELFLARSSLFYLDIPFPGRSTH